MNVRCSSPTCQEGLNLPGAETAPFRLLSAALERLGWTVEQWSEQDPRPLPYCPRCSS